jgi:hypothetical protein
MNKRALHSLDVKANGTDEDALLVEQYFADHPDSPSATRRPKVLRQGDIFVALLGRDVQHGIVGLGNTVENALRAFDLQYCIELRSPEAQSVPAKVRGHGGK